MGPARSASSRKRKAFRYLCAIDDRCRCPIEVFCAPCSYIIYTCVSFWFPPHVGIVLGAHLLSCALCLSSPLPADFRGGYNQVCHSQPQLTAEGAGEDVPAGLAKTLDPGTLAEPGGGRTGYHGAPATNYIQLHARTHNSSKMTRNLRNSLRNLGGLVRNFAKLLRETWGGPARNSYQALQIACL